MRTYVRGWAYSTNDTWVRVPNTVPAYKWEDWDRNIQVGSNAMLSQANSSKNGLNTAF